jgi:hypothetical protein
MSDIKMSDVFDLPLVVDGNTLAESTGGQHSGFFSHRQDNAAANAINSHDALIEHNKALKAALEGLCCSPHTRLTKHVLLEVSEADIDIAIKTLKDNS